MSSYHLDPCTTNRDKTTLNYVLLDLLVQCWVGFLHPLKLLSLQQHNDTSIQLLTS